jgi:hypothetical protein
VARRCSFRDKPGELFCEDGLSILVGIEDHS